MLKSPNHSEKVSLGRLHRYTLIVGIVSLLLAFFIFISPLLTVLIAAGVIAIDLVGLNDWLVSKIKSRGLAAFLVTIVALLVIVTPLVLFTIFAASEAVSWLKNLFTAIDWENFTLASLVPEAFSNTNWGQNLINYLNSSSVSNIDFAGIIRESLSSLTSLSGQIFTQTTNLFKSLSLVLVYSLIFVFCLFYFLYDGHSFVKHLKKLIPLPTGHKDALFTKLSQLSKGITYGVFGAALVQGVLGTIGFLIAGIDNPVFWGAMMAVFSPVPYIGPTIIWGPIVLVLGFNGDFFSAIFIALWGMLIVGTSDNLVKPYLIGKSVEINPLLVMLTLIGGILVVGLEAIIYAPFLLSLLFSFLHIYEIEYLKE